MRFPGFHHSSGRARAGLLLCALLLPALLMGASGPAGMEVPVDRQVPLLSRVLAFDRSLQGSAPLVVAVIYQEQNRESRQTLAAFQHAVGSSMSIQGRPVRVVPVAVTSAGSVPRALRRAGADVAYVAPLRSISASAVARAASGEGVLTLTGVRRYVSDGVAVGVGLRNGRPEILLNRGAARSAGADLSARLLQLATIVDG